MEIFYYLLFEKLKSCLVMFVNWDIMFLNLFVNFFNVVMVNRLDWLVILRFGGWYFGLIGGNLFILFFLKFDWIIFLLIFFNILFVVFVEIMFKMFI